MNALLRSASGDCRNCSRTDRGDATTVPEINATNVIASGIALHIYFANFTAVLKKQHPGQQFATLIFLLVVWPNAAESHHFCVAHQLSDVSNGIAAAKTVALNLSFALAALTRQHNRQEQGTKHHSRPI